MVDNCIHNVRRGRLFSQDEEGRLIEVWFLWRIKGGRTWEGWYAEFDSLSTCAETTHCHWYTHCRSNFVVCDNADIAYLGRSWAKFVQPCYRKSCVIAAGVYNLCGVQYRSRSEFGFVFLQDQY
ncbi:hypothetical protein Dimus_032549 [Dionaea muscipula]